MQFIAPSRYQQFKASGQLPSPSGIALAILSLLQRDDCKLDDLVRLIQSDPAIAGQVLKISNAAIYGHRRPIISLPKAVTTLGTTRVGTLVLGLSVLQRCNEKRCPQFDYQRFWSRALATAISAQALARYAKVAGEENFTAGLLCSIGELALASIFPDQYGGIVSATSAAAERLELERRTFGIDHRELGVTMLRDWHLPDVLVAGVYHSEIPDDADFMEGSRSFLVSHALHISLALADICVGEEAARWKMVPNLFLKAARLGIDEEDELSSLANNVFKSWREWGEMLEVKTHEIPEFENLLVSPPPEIVGNASTSAATPTSRSALVVTSNPSEGATIASYLGANGFDVQSASSGADGLRIALVQLPKLILIELITPGTDAQTFCRSLRASLLSTDIYIIVICDREDEGKLAMTVDAGADDFLLRPITQLTLAARLNAADRVMHLQSQVLKEHHDLAKSAVEWVGSNRNITIVAMTDLLTHLPNRRHGLDFLAAEWAHAHGNNLPIACLMIDIDHFKSINDKYGHKNGDAVLAAVSHRLKSSARSEDMVFRYGGEEFCLISPGTNRSRAIEIAERIRHNLAAASFNLDELNIAVTVSIGVAAVSPPYGTSEEALIADADAALARAKLMGRNRVEVAA